MRKICLLASVAIVAAVGIALGSHEKSDSDSDRARGDTWQTWNAVNQNPSWSYRELHPVLFQPEAIYRPIRLAARAHHPAATPLPRPRPRMVAQRKPAPTPLQQVAQRHPTNLLEALFGSF